MTRTVERLAILLALCISAAGCAVIRQALEFERQGAQARELARIEGRVETELPAEGPLVVVLLRAGETESDPPVPADTFVRQLPGSFRFPVAPGRYRLGAYEDRNQNRKLDPGERMRSSRGGPVLRVGPGEAASENILIAASATTPPEMTEPLDVFDLVARTPREQLDFSLWTWSVQGEICEDLSDARFGLESANRGLWQIMDFLNDGLAGIYFMGSYDPKRIPVLFVHGIAGTPQQLGPLMDALDSERFQPWFYFYPSGFSLNSIASHLATLLARIQVETGFDELAIVAHSAGGLVSRAAIFEYERETRREDVRLFIAISTPWGGQASAAGAANAHIELPPSFVDLAPSSDFLRRLFYQDGGGKIPRPLPDSVEFQMFIGFRMRSQSATANDGTVALSSQALPEAQRQARGLLAVDAGHVDILAAPETLERVNELLARRFR